MDEYIKTVIKEEIDKGYKKFIICPMGKWGKRGKEILLEFGIEPVYCIDSYEYDDKEIFKMDVLSGVQEDVRCLLLTQRLAVKKELIRQIESYIENSKVVDVFKRVDDIITTEKIAKFPVEDRVKLDFLCVGFSKCGTTSLHAYFEENPYVFVPEVKENQFLLSISEKSHKFLKDSYPLSLTAGKIVGDIEPVYYNSAFAAKEYFGDDIKIIFCLRNPADALFSYFKMRMRRVTNHTLEFIEKKGEVSTDYFEEWSTSFTERFKYADYIKEYLKYYPREQIFFLISEEMYAAPQKTLGQLLDYLELDGEKSEIFPHENSGSMVVKDLVSARISNYLMNFFFESFNESLEMRKKLEHVMGEIDIVITTPFKGKLPVSVREKILLEYMDSIKELEVLIGRSLQGIWY